MQSRLQLPCDYCDFLISAGHIPGILLLLSKWWLITVILGEGVRLLLILHRRQISKTGKAPLLALQNSQVNTKSSCGPSVLRAQPVFCFSPADGQQHNVQQQSRGAALGLGALSVPSAACRMRCITQPLH